VPGEAGPDFVPSALVAVDRAAGDLRRGLPVAVIDGRESAVLVVAGELAREEVLAALKTWSGAAPDLVLTPSRAATLKIRLYTPEAVRVPFPPWMTAEMVRGLADPTTDLAQPLRGPFQARREPVPGAALAALNLAKIARLLPAMVTVPAPVPAGEMAAWATARGLMPVAAEDIAAYPTVSASSLEQVASARVPLEMAEEARILTFRPKDGGLEHLAIVIGEPRRPGPVLIRIHSECFTGDLLGSLRCDCGDQLRGAIAQIAKEGSGIVLYLAQEGRGIGLTNKLRAYALQDQGFDTMEANERLGYAADERLFEPAVEMLHRMGFTEVRLLTNNPDKVAALERLGVRVVERVPHAFSAKPHNAFYLSTKASKAGHYL
jgi:GTP cyclohydrolase II